MAIDTVKELSAFVDNPTFERLLKRTTTKPLSYAEFSLLPMPDSADPEEVWALISKLRKATAQIVEVGPYPFLDSPNAWFTLTDSTMEEILDTESLGGPNSQANFLYLKNPSAWMRSHDVVSEITEAVNWDGSHASYESIRGVVQEERMPHTPDERIAYNYVNALEKHGASVNLRSSHSISDLYGQLMDGIGEVHCGHECCEAIASILELSKTSGMLGAILNGIYFQDYVRFYQLTPAYNATFGSLLRKLYLASVGYPVLGLVPMAAQLRSWNEGHITAPSVFDSFENSKVLIGNEVDLTAWFDSYMHLLHTELEEVVFRIVDANEYDKTLRSAIKATNSLNYRQRDVLMEALRRRNAAFTIKDHMETYDVVYSTARADLMGLMQFGFLNMQKRQKAFTFTAVPNLRRIIGRLTPA